MNVNKEKAIEQLEILSNSRGGTSEHTKAIIYLCQYISLSYEPITIEKVNDVKECTESKEPITNPYRLGTDAFKAEGSI